MGITALIGGIGEAIAGITAGIGGAVATGVGALGVGAETAAGIGAIAGPAIFGAGAGALTSAVAGGNPLTGAIAGGLGGGLIGAVGGAGGALTGALGGSQAASGALIGAGAGAIGNAVTGGNPLTGAIYGGVGGGALGALNGYVGGQGSGSLVNSDGSIVTPPIPPQLDASGNPVMVGGAPQYGGGTQADANAAVQQTAESTPGYINTPAGQVSGLNAQSSTSSGVAKGALSNPALILGALSAVSSLLNKPQVGTYPTPGPASNAANLGPLYNAPLNTNVPGRTAVTPTVPNYYTYGQIPGGAQYFTGNSLSNYGFAKGGALNSVANSNDPEWVGPGEEFRTADGRHHVRGPGTGVSDSIPAALSDGEYVLTRKEVSSISPKRSNNGGARKLDRLRKTGALSQILKAA